MAQKTKTISFVAISFVLFLFESKSIEILESKKKDLYVAKGVFVDLVGYSDEKSAKSTAIETAKMQGLEDILRVVYNKKYTIPPHEVNRFVFGFEQKSSTFNQKYHTSVFDVVYIKKEIEDFLANEVALEHVSRNDFDISSLQISLAPSKSNKQEVYAIVYKALDDLGIDYRVYSISRKKIDFIFKGETFFSLKQKLQSKNIAIIENGQEYYIALKS